MSNSSIKALRDLLRSMDYPIVQKMDADDRVNKIRYVCEMSEQYKNTDKVIDFIKETKNNNFKEVFELIYDSDLFKGD